MKLKKLKQAAALFLSVAMIMAVTPILPGSVTSVQAGAAPFVTKFATKEELTSVFKLDGTGTGAKINFGGGDMEWLITGAEGTFALVLLSTSSFGNSTYGTNSSYSNSPIATTILPGFTSNSDYFSAKEQEYMMSVSVLTKEYTGATSSVIGKLYLPNTVDEYGFSDINIYVGSWNQIKVKLDLARNSGLFVENFWLRSPYVNDPWSVLTGLNMDFLQAVSYVPYSDNSSIVPAFHLNLSTVLFASIANAAASDGALGTDDAFTVRYASTSLGSATVNTAETSITVAGAPAGTYLVVQNGSGAWAKSVTGNTILNAGDVTINGSPLTSLAGCKVWLESTTSGRITTATLATIGDAPAPTPTPAAAPAITGTGNNTTAQSESYVITQGADQVLLPDSNSEPLSVTCSGALEKLTGIYVDGNLLDAAYYTLKSGSTILTLKPEYLSSLSPGTHTLMFQYGSESAQTTLQIADAAKLPQKDNVPKTGDFNPIVELLGLVFFSGAGLLWFGNKRKSLNN